jgi:phosphatidylserine/phosphatidylglycerophosphate/cardiolipin synthase-like enzyme
VRFQIHPLVFAVVLPLCLVQCRLNPSTETLIIKTENSASVSVCFTPGEECAKKIVDEIASAKQSIWVQAYSFTSQEIARALVVAMKRGVELKVILDRSQKGDRYSSYDFFSRSGVSVLLDSKHAIAHNKIMVIDGKRVITGSFNFTKAAQEKNAENLLFIEDPEIAQAYSENFLKHWRHAEKSEFVSKKKKKTQTLDEEWILKTLLGN